jgi:SAM-dependent methyltransferase
MPIPRFLRSAVSHLVYPPRLPTDTEPTEEEMEAWMAVEELEYFKDLDKSFVGRALDLGVDSGMVLDLGSRLGLIPLRILWDNENFFGIGLQRWGVVADRARETANAWDLGERMFFQVDDLHRIKFKEQYFDLVVSDSALHRFENPLDILTEINRVTKPTSGILIRDFLRPNRFGLSRHRATYGEGYPEPLRDSFEASFRAGFTERELVGLVAEAGLRGARVWSDNVHLTIERPGTSDPGSWVTERENYF